MKRQQQDIKDAGWLLLIILVIVLLQIQKATAQNVGIGTPTPVARFHAADSVKEQQKQIDELNKKVSHLATHHKKA